MQPHELRRQHQRREHRELAQVHGRIRPPDLLRTRGERSELTWMVMPTLNWRPWKRWSFHVGYKRVKAERERPSTNRDRDLELSGPVLGVGFHF